MSTYLDKNYRFVENEIFKGIVFKTMVDPFIGKMSYIKIDQGTLNKDTDIYNLSKNQKKKYLIYIQ